MERKILVYGHGGKRPYPVGFPQEEDSQRWIERDIFQLDDRRYRYSQKKQADIIVLSREGKAYGHFEIAGTEPPNEKDCDAYDKTRFVYHVKSSQLYPDPVLLSSLGIKGFQHGRYITEAQFDEVKKRAGLT